MSTAKHTPGPWHVTTVRTSVGVCHKVGPFPGKKEGDSPRHACLYADYPSADNPRDAELLANARLIASSPRLLASLKWALSAMAARNPMWTEGEHYAEAMAAVAAAEGQP